MRASVADHASLTPEATGCWTTDVGDADLTAAALRALVERSSASGSPSAHAA
mgnify:CR=1 FL=1